jgi:uncharacterized alkaline shock family protein YloU
MRVFRGVANLVALAVTGGLGVTLIIAGAGGISLGSVTPYLDQVPGTIFTILVGVVLVLIALRFVIAAADERVRAGVFARDAEGGRVALTSYAVREFISGILRDEMGLDRFHVGLQHRRGGVAITVRVTLSPSQRVTSISERIQSVLARQVPERTGIDVSDVAILVRGIRSTGRNRGPREEIIHAPDIDR